MYIFRPASVSPAGKSIFSVEVNIFATTAIVRTIASYLTLDSKHATIETEDFGFHTFVCTGKM